MWGPEERDSTPARRALADEVPRTHLLERLGRRWDAPLTTIVAPAGFGKSVVLRQSVEANRNERRGIDLVVTCRPSDAAADRLAGRVLAGMQVDAPTDDADPAELALMIANAMAARSPQWAGLVLDDVHELGSDSAAVHLILALLREMPATGHLVLVGRSLPDSLPLARLRASDSLVEVEAADLAFDEADIAHLMRARGGASTAESVDVASLGGWPALVRLVLTAGQASSMEYLRQEVLAGLSPSLRRALGVAIVADGADDRLLAEAGSEHTADALAAEVPLVDRGRNGAVPHALWREILDRVLPDGERAEVVRVVADVLRRRGDEELALEVLAGAGTWDGAAAVVLAALRTDGPLISRTKAARWVQLFPEAERRRAEVLLLQGVVQRLTATERRDPHGRAAAYFTDGDDPLDDSIGERHEVLLGRAAEAFVTEARPEGAAAALVHMLWSALDLGDSVAITEVRDQMVALDRRWPGATGVYGRVADALATWLDGDPKSAAAALDAVVAGALDPSTRAFVELQRAPVWLFLGDAERAVQATRAAQEAAVEATGVEPVSQHLVVSWLAGDPGPALGILGGPQQVAAPSPQDRFRAIIYGHTFGASLALAPPFDVDAARVQASGTWRDEVAIALAAATVDVAMGDEATAIDRLADIDLVAAIEDQVAVGEVVHFVPLVHTLAPQARVALDTLTRGIGGALHGRTGALARLLVAVREGGDPTWDDLPPPPTVMAWLPLPWSVGLAVAAHGAGRSEGVELIDYLLDVVGEPARALLRREAVTPGDAASNLLAAVPTPPDEVVKVAVLGGLEVGHGDTAPEPPRRRRVRELLALLALRGEVTRDVAMATLWPDLDGDRARNNLNVTVRHLRSVLEPARRGGEAPFVLRTEGGRIRLMRSPHLKVDLWDLRRHLSEGRGHEEAGSLEAALGSYRAAVADWRGEPLADLAYVDVVAGEREGLRADLVDAACRGAELAVARGQAGLARELADRALVEDPLGDRALCALLAAALVDGDTDRARSVVARAEAAADELGVGLSAELRMLARQLSPA